MAWWTALTNFTRRRVLTAEEYAWAQGVFGDTLQARERIRVSPAVGLKRRPFTFPTGFGRRTTIFLGQPAPDPVHTNPSLFAHELTHVWQIAHAKPLIGWRVKAIVTQIRFSLGQNVYGLRDPTTPWKDLTLEQQATVVEHWIGHRDDDTGHDLQHYLDENVRSAGKVT